MFWFVLELSPGIQKSQPYRLQRGCVNDSQHQVCGLHIGCLMTSMGGYGSGLFWDVYSLHRGLCLSGVSFFVAAAWAKISPAFLLPMLTMYMLAVSGCGLISQGLFGGCKQLYSKDFPDGVDFTSEIRVNQIDSFLSLLVDFDCMIAFISPPHAPPPRLHREYAQPPLFLIFIHRERRPEGLSSHLPPHHASPPRLRTGHAAQTQEEWRKMYM